MLTREFTCPSCGAPVPQKTPGARTLVCGFCGQTSHINAESLSAVGSQHLLIDYGSALGVGQQGRYDGRDFLVMGRLRLDYKDGFWDEWFLQFLDDGTSAWLQEDDGSFVMFSAAEPLDRFPDFDAIAVGTEMNIDTVGSSVFITSKGRAKVNGGEGELPFRIIPGDPADFVDGIVDGRIISVEVLPTETLRFIGFEVSLDDLALSAHPQAQ